jgi:hypothetical protein
MTPDRQVQRGGDGNQFQAGRDIVHITGLDVETAREIFESRAVMLRAELTAHAEAVVNARVTGLERALFAKFGTPELLQAFANPDFQFNVLEAQRSAARSGDAADIDLIVDLLVQRAEASESPRLRVATRRALETVGQLSTEALAGLTVLWYGISLTPEEHTLPELLRSMNTHLEPLVADLPTDAKWLGDLSLVDCVQVGFSGIGALKNLIQFIGERKAPAFTCRGFPSSLEDISSSLRAIHPQFESLIVAHPLDEARRVLLGRDEQDARKLASGVAVTMSVDISKVEAAIAEAVTATGYDERLPQWEELLRARFKDFQALEVIDSWWKDLPPLSITAVGVAIAFANLKRLLPRVSLPTLDIVM